MAYEEGDEGGELRGCSNLGVAFHSGQGGLPKDDKKAVELFQRSAKGVL
ncbi:MAG: SEL1-like repeat protein [Polyangiaceae bacterium]|nr:SEL1-like repeat protein [Polyangiaceae bacterium]